MVVALAIALASTTMGQQDNRPSSAKDTIEGEMLTAEKFAYGVALSGQMEVRLAEMATSKAASSEVKNFAEMLAKDHAAVNKELAGIAKSKNLELPADGLFARKGGFIRPPGAAIPTRHGQSDAAPPRLGTPNYPAGEKADNVDRRDVAANPQHEAKIQQARATIDRLEALSGSEFDREYVNEMVQSHTKSIAKFQKASQHLSDPELKAFASRTLPKLREHLDHAQQLSKDYVASATTVPPAPPKPPTPPAAETTAEQSQPDKR